MKMRIYTTSRYQYGFDAIFPSHQDELTALVVDKTFTNRRSSSVPGAHLAWLSVSPEHRHMATYIKIH